MSHLHTCPFKAGIARDLCSAACGFDACTGKTPPAGPVIGSLFSGYGGLEQGVQAVLGGRVAWHVENGTAPAKILEHNHPGVPNYGDVTAVDWQTVEPVDVLTLGFPCQDLSGAGNRAGLRPGTRSGLWEHAAYAIHELAPPLVVIENVRGLLDAPAHSDVEPCPWCLDDGPDCAAMRALGAVLSDLARLGYDAEWCGLRASDVGAPHGRFRVFVVARRRDAAPDAGRERHGTREGARGVGRVDCQDEGQALERQRARQELVRGVETHRDRFGAYAAAVARWEIVTGRPAPDPVDEPAFGEWMMGLPAGHVTAVPGITPDDMLKAIGNGVVPRQAAAALEWLLAVPA